MRGGSPDWRLRGEVIGMPRIHGQLRRPGLYVFCPGAWPGCAWSNASTMGSISDADF
jgi:hypothetical protein